MGDLVLVHNMAIKKSLTAKCILNISDPLSSFPKQPKEELYIICELNGSVFNQLIAVFQVIPYFARKSITLPDRNDFFKSRTGRLHDMRVL